MDEGYIKFNLDWVSTPTQNFPEFVALNSWRSKLVKLGLVGAYSNGVGFGNLSTRVGSSNNFFITGSATGSFSVLSLNQYTKVTAFDFEKNWLSCVGGFKASSESLTHAAVYASISSCNAVFHVHHKKLWQHLMGTLPSTSSSAEYGTPQMANEVFRLFKESNVSVNKIFAMGGHEEGVVSFGSSLDEAGKVLLDQFASLE